MPSSIGENYQVENNFWNQFYFGQLNDDTFILKMAGIELNLYATPFHLFSVDGRGRAWLIFAFLKNLDQNL